MDWLALLLTYLAVAYPAVGFVLYGVCRMDPASASPAPFAVGVLWLVAPVALALCVPLAALVGLVWLAGRVLVGRTR